MKRTNNNVRFGLSRVLLLVLIAVMALTVVSCGKSETETEGEAIAKTFTFQVIALDGETTTFTITTERETVGEALFDEGLIEGEPGAYGLYVKRVNGILADYDVDGTYWAFYLNGAYGMTGVDLTEIDPTVVYEFRVTK